MAYQNDPKISRFQVSDDKVSSLFIFLDTYVKNASDENH